MLKRHERFSPHAGESSSLCVPDCVGECCTSLSMWQTEIDRDGSVLVYKNCDGEHVCQCIAERPRGLNKYVGQ